MSEDTIFKMFSAMVPVLLIAMGNMYNIMRGMQKQLDRCIDRLADKE